MKIPFFMLASFGIFATAFADPFCRPGQEIYDEAEMCEDNYLFVRAADACVTKLNEEVASATAALSRKFVRNDGKNQSTNFHSSLSDYGFSAETLARLIALNRQALADVKDYYPRVIEAEDMDEVEDLEEWGINVPCYFRTRKSLLHVAEVLETKLHNLEAAKRVADAHNGTSRARETNVGAVPGGTKVLRGSVGNGAGRVPTGKNPHPASTITGVEEAKDKEPR